MDFELLLKQYLSSKREEMLKKWNRILPTNELLYDRWEKAKFLGCGENTSIYDTSVVMGNVEIGDNVWIGPFTLLEGLNGKLKIGDYCHISSGVQINTHDTVRLVLSNGKLGAQKGDVIIGHNTHIGSMTIIARGVTIGHHCVIGAHSFVNKDIPDFSIAFGAPAKVAGKVVMDGDEIKFEYYKDNVVKNRE